MTLDRNNNRPNVPPRFKCSTRPSCKVASAKADEVIEAVLYVLEYIELPKLEAKLANGEGNAAAVQKRRIEKLSKQMMETFREKCGSTVCRELKGVDTGKVLCSCPDCIRAGVETVQEVLGL